MDQTSGEIGSNCLELEQLQFPDQNLLQHKGEKEKQRTLSSWNHVYLVLEHEAMERYGDVLSDSCRFLMRIIHLSP